MAKKQSMNFLELHLEKIFLTLAFIAAMAIVLLSFMNRNGKSASALTNEAVGLAEAVAAEAEQEKSNSSPLLDSPELKATKFIHVPPLTPSFVDNNPMGPPCYYKIEPSSVYQKIHVPEITALSDIIIDFQRTRAYVTDELNQQQIKDVDFVTVEATCPLAQLRKDFEREFKNPDLIEPIQYPEPIVAAVELQRSQMLPDGSWSPWQKINRLEVDPMAEKEVPSEDFNEISEAEYEVLLQTRSNPETQLLILRPQPWKLVDGVWLTPSQRVEQARLAKESERIIRPPLTTPTTGPARGLRSAAARRPRNVPGATRDNRRELPSRETITQPGRIATPARPTGPMGPAGPTSTMRPAGPMGPAGPTGPMGPAGPMGPTGTLRPTVPAGYGTLGPGGFTGAAQITSLFEEDKITLWAHDSNLKSGVFYRYHISIGFFNPIAGKDWFEEDQQQLKNKIILWSKPAEPEKMVYVPKKTIFFPSSGSATAQTVRVDVCHWQNGLWHKKSFSVTPGSTIGQLYKSSVDASTAVALPQREITIDYRTGITLLDVIPDSKHWCLVGRSYRDIVTNDIIYRDTDGVVKRLGVDNRCWPQEMKDKRSEINKAIRDQTEKVAGRG